MGGGNIFYNTNIDSWGKKRKDNFQRPNPSSSPLGSHEYAQKLICPFSNSINPNLIKNTTSPCKLCLTSLGHQCYNSSTASSLHAIHSEEFHHYYCPSPDT